MNSGNRMRLKTGEVVTVVSKVPGNLLCKTAEGNIRYVSIDQICHVLNTPCEICDSNKKQESNKKETDE